MSYFLVADHKVEPFDGDLDDYRQWLLKQKRDVNEPKIAETTNKTKKKKPANLQRVARLEKEMEVLEKKTN